MFAAMITWVTTSGALPAASALNAKTPTSLLSTTLVLAAVSDDASPISTFFEYGHCTAGDPDVGVRSDVIAAHFAGIRHRAEADLNAVLGDEVDVPEAFDEVVIDFRQPHPTPVGDDPALLVGGDDVAGHLPAHNRRVVR